jgi:hypothetical protein
MERKQREGEGERSFLMGAVSRLDALFWKDRGRHLCVQLAGQFRERNKNKCRRSSFRQSRLEKDVVVEGKGPLGGREDHRAGP